MSGDVTKLAGLGHFASGHAGKVNGLINVREIGADVRVDRLRAATMLEDNLVMLGGQAHHIIVIAIASGEDHFEVAVDHAFHDAVGIGVFRDVFHVLGGNAGNLLFTIRRAWF